MTTSSRCRDTSPARSSTLSCTRSRCRGRDIRESKQDWVAISPGPSILVAGAGRLGHPLRARTPPRPACAGTGPCRLAPRALAADSRREHRRRSRLGVRNPVAGHRVQRSHAQAPALRRTRRGPRLVGRSGRQDHRGSALCRRAWVLLGTWGDDDSMRAEPFDAVPIDLAPLWAWWAGFSPVVVFSN